METQLRRSRPPFHCVFLDTNVVRYLSTLTPFIDDGLGEWWEVEKLRRIGSQKVRQDISALENFPPLFNSGLPHGLAITETVVAELSVMSHPFGEELLGWCIEMGFVGSHTPNNFFPNLATVLDTKDRELYLQAASLGCDAFLTTDYKTIVNRRERLPAWGPRVVTPTEWWDEMRPWAGLFL